MVGWIMKRGHFISLYQEDSLKPYLMLFISVGHGWDPALRVFQASGWSEKDLSGQVLANWSICQSLYMVCPVPALKQTKMGGD